MVGERQRIPAALLIPIYALVGVVLYVLSIGPAAWLINSGYLGPAEEFVLRWYWPLAWLAEHSPSFQSVGEVYVNLWIQ